jgi:hypothetical protein
MLPLQVPIMSSALVTTSLIIMTRSCESAGRTGVEEQMEELYVEGLATHGGPESCVDDLRGRGEALTGARAAG